MNKKEVPIWEKSNLTLEEAAAYSGIGINKLRELSNRDDCEFVLWVGSKRLIKRRLLDQFLERCFSIYSLQKKSGQGRTVHFNCDTGPMVSTMGPVDERSFISA